MIRPDDDLGAVSGLAASGCALGQRWKAIRLQDQGTAPVYP